MPKRVGFLYDRMVDKPFIEKSINKGLQQKNKDRKDVKSVRENREGYRDTAYHTLATCSYRPSAPKEKHIIDVSSNKPRTIGIQPFNTDGIYHIITVEAMMPVLMRGMHHWSCAAIKGRGGKRMFNYVRRIVQQQPRNSKYIAELDIKQFYPSIPLKRLMQAYERKIKDKKFLLHLAIIISCAQITVAEAIEQGLTPYDIVGDKVGIHIGFVTSQWSGNFYLEPVDRFILTLDGVKCEARYADNIIITGRNKKKLHRAIDAINQFLADELGLTLKENWQIYPPGKRLVSTVGYRIGRNCVILRQRNFLRVARQSRRIQKKIENHKRIPPSMARSFMSRIGLLKHTDCKYAQKTYIKPVSTKRLRGVISADDKQRKERKR